jgi:hypothetical protein
VHQPCHRCTDDKTSNIGECWQGIINKAWVVNRTTIATNSHVFDLSRGYQANEQCTNHAIHVLMIMLARDYRQGLDDKQDNHCHQFACAQAAIK